MLDTYRKLYMLLSSAERKRALRVFLLMMIVAFFETAGVASVLPFIAVLSNPEMIESNAALSAAYEYTGLDSTEAFIKLLGSIFLAVVMVTLVFKGISQWQQLSFTKMQVHHLGYRFNELFLSHDYEWFIGKKTSQMTTKILSEVNKVISASMYPAMQFVAHTVVVVAIFSFLLAIDPVVAILSGVFLGGAYGLIYYVVRKPIKRYGDLRYTANLVRFKIVHETYGGLKEIKLSHLEKSQLDRFDKPSFYTAKNEVRVEALRQIPGYFMQAFLFLGVVMVLITLTYKYGSFSAALPTFSAFAFAGYRLMPSLQQMYSNLTSVRSAAMPLDELIKDMHDAEDGVAPSVGVSSVGPVNAVTFSDVHYSYPNSEESAIKALSIVVQKNNKIAFVGKSGSGKSTTADLLLGLLKPTKGYIDLGGKRLDQSTVYNWQNSLGYVPQSIYLADDTVTANIAFGVPKDEVNMDKVIKAAQAAHLDEFVRAELTAGYDTLIGEKGDRLSGGQKQRIGIARALYKNPDILIFDEATSALDNVTERGVMAAIDELSKTKTIIIIAHRLTTVENCDVIYFFDGGKVLAQGTYDELSRTSPEFQEMLGFTQT